MSSGAPSTKKSSFGVLFVLVFVVVGVLVAPNSDDLFPNPDDPNILKHDFLNEDF